jgi:hypothetical protein
LPYRNALVVATASTNALSILFDLIQSQPIKSYSHLNLHAWHCCRDIAIDAMIDLSVFPDKFFTSSRLLKNETANGLRNQT